MKLLVGVLLTICLLSAQINAESWTQVSKDVSTFIYGIDFVSDSQGWLAGFNLLSPFGAQILQTNDSGATFIQGTFTSKMEAIEFMAIDFNSNYGVAAGSGVSLLPGVSVSSDGQNWATPETEIILEATFTDVNTLPDQSAIVVGSWRTALGDNTGYLQSDNASKFKGQSWPYSLPARYGSFLNTSYGWISGGNKSPFIPGPLADGSIVISHDVAIDITNGRLKHIQMKETNFQGIIAQTTDGGRRFDVLYNSTASGTNLYFNGIQFVDVSNGWAVAVEYSLVSNSTYSYIFNTNDGGNTWTTQLSEEHVRLFRIRMYDSQNGWAVGWKLPSLTLFTGEFYRTTDGGKRWTKNTIRDVIGFDVSNVNATNAYAVAFGLDLSTNLYYYS